MWSQRHTSCDSKLWRPDHLHSAARLLLKRRIFIKYNFQLLDLSEPVIPPKEKKFKGYFKIARHYGWALNKTFVEMGFDQVGDILQFICRQHQVIQRQSIEFDSIYEQKTFSHQVIVVEDDLEISPDFFEYFSATLPLLRQDKSLW